MPPKDERYLVQDDRRVFAELRLAGHLQSGGALCIQHHHQLVWAHFIVHLTPDCMLDLHANTALFSQAD